ncbi:MAG TPA: PH domain-containing protein [Candidatus Acidoferrum sp.]|nr:PH domain-containing protein [Candidatus Acidoferrum sp.]
MGYIEQNLIPGETVLYKTRLHWIVFMRPLIVGLLLGSIGLVFTVGGYEASGKDVSYGGMILIGVLLILAAAISIGAGLIKKKATEVAVSNRRVVIKSGFMARKTIEVALSKVESVGVDESAFGRMLGYGDVIVRGTGGTTESFTRIANPEELSRRVQGQIGQTKTG